MGSLHLWKRQGRRCVQRSGLSGKIAGYFGIPEYRGYLWTAHNRFPTNTPGWWGGAHPFALLDWTVVHNGEISSYGTNRRYLEMRGYHCTMYTDTEVMAYAADLLMRRHRLPMRSDKAVAPPLCRPRSTACSSQTNAVPRPAPSLRDAPDRRPVRGDPRSTGRDDRAHRPYSSPASDRGQQWRPPLPCVGRGSYSPGQPVSGTGLQPRWGEPVIGRLGMSLQPPELAVPEQASRQMTQALALASAV